MCGECAGLPDFDVAPLRYNIGLGVGVNDANLSAEVVLNVETPFHAFL